MRQPATDTKLEQPHKGSRRRVRLLLITLFGFLAWAGVIAWNQQARLDAKSAQASELDTKLTETKKLNADYKKEVERLNDPEYILQKIRKEYHYTKPGETLFYTPKS
ncbi:septum formation initiator family protein [Paenibacillus sp. HJGM_3]|uniref:FtsB family cell division protein n=1 Tax=Paenibacillus sp. HJGM_3 TaxID=3379816 RepID=UPI0038594433